MVIYLSNKKVEAHFSPDGLSHGFKLETLFFSK